MFTVFFLGIIFDIQEKLLGKKREKGEKNSH
jgi:hypothetical protein